MNRVKSLLVGISCFVAMASGAQSPYRDSLTAFQLHYKEELYPIIRGDTSHIRFYPVDENYKVIATVEKLQGEQFFPMATSSRMKKQAIRYVKLTFQLKGDRHVLYGYQLSMLLETEKYKNNFFVPFTDGTSGDDSYEGGKYIDFVTSDITADNKLVIDFNRSYNPYCAFRKGYNCPIPPKENMLTAEIRAGEMSFLK